LYNAGYSKNIFNDLLYIFNLKKEFNIIDWYDYFNNPITDIYFFIQYKPIIGGLGINEIIKKTKWSGVTDGDEYIEDYTYQQYNIGDIIYGDKIEYSSVNIVESNISPQIHYIQMSLLKDPEDPLSVRTIQWKYNTLTPIKLRDVSDDVKRYNISGTSYNDVVNIPIYAHDIGNGNMIWREILPQGYIDPISGRGVDIPFVNGRRYKYDNLQIVVQPDLNDDSTFDLFSEVKFSDPNSITNKPKELNKTNEPC
jgi:hypothetical protein